MQIVINIREEIYQEAIDSGYSHLYDEEVANAVANGTPLPTGHGRLIDADALKISENYDGIDAMNAVYSAPTIIEADKEGK